MPAGFFGGGGGGGLRDIDATNSGLVAGGAGDVGVAVGLALFNGGGVSLVGEECFSRNEFKRPATLYFLFH
jgi:hypothetical protein